MGSKFQWRSLLVSSHIDNRADGRRKVRLVSGKWAKLSVLRRVRWLDVGITASGCRIVELVLLQDIGRMRRKQLHTSLLILRRWQFANWSVCIVLYGHYHVHYSLILNPCLDSIFVTITSHFILINQPTRCNSLSNLLLDLYVQLNMFRASSRLSSGTQQLQQQPLVLPVERGDSSAVGCGRAGPTTAFTTLRG